MIWKLRRGGIRSAIVFGHLKCSEHSWKIINTLTVHFFENICNFLRKCDIFLQNWPILLQKNGPFCANFTKKFVFYHNFLPLQCSSMQNVISYIISYPYSTLAELYEKHTLKGRPSGISFTLSAPPPGKGFTNFLTKICYLQSN